MPTARPCRPASPPTDPPHRRRVRLGTADRTADWTDGATGVFITSRTAGGAGSHAAAGAATWARAWLAAILALPLLGGIPVGSGPFAPRTAVSASQPSTQVYVDDSTRAHDLLRRAIEQSRDNAGEAVRQLQVLLDEFGLRLVPIAPTERDVFSSVRRRVLDVLRRDPELLERYRLVETGEAERLLAAGEIDRLIATRPLTGPGLEARLRAGQGALETARFDEAIDHLQAAIAHPDAGARPATAVAAWSMLGLASHYAAGLPDVDPASAVYYAGVRTAALAALDELGSTAEAARRELGDLVAADQGAPVGSASGPMDRADTIDFQQTVGEVIWSTDPSAGESAVDPGVGRRRTGADPREVRTAAAIGQDAVFICDGLRVAAVDRFTARPLWDPPYIESNSSELLRDDVIGIRPVSVSGQAVVTIVGAASTDQASTNNSAYVLRLDARTGRREWRRALRRLGGVEEFEGLFPHGKPWIADGRVHVLARRLTPEKLLSCYVVTLDLETGEPIWIRHVASIGARQVGHPVSSLTYDRGRLFVASPVGATASLDAATGEFQWLVRSDVPSTFLGARAQPYEVGAPLVLDRRIVSIRPDRAAVEIRSRDDGLLEASVAIGLRTPWGEPDYLLTDGIRLYAVADDVRCFSLELLDAPLWTAPRAPGEELTPMSLPGEEPALGVDAAAPDTAASTSMSADRPPVAGRVVVAGESLLVPTTVGLLVVDRETGVTGARLDLGPGGIPSASGAQLVLSGADRTLGWMSLVEAESLLRQRIAELPEEAGPRLSLLRLAVRIGRLDLVLETARFALDAANATDREEDTLARRELFETLIAVDTDRLLADEADARRYFDVLDLIVARDDERIAASMAEGDWLASRNTVAAVAAWQTILADPGLAATARIQDDVHRPARAWAIDRIVALLRTAGDPVRATIDDMSWQSVAGAIGAGPTPPADRSALQGIPAPRLEAAAAAWPFAAAGVAAGTEAASRLAASGDLGAAARVLLRLYRDAPDDGRAAALLGRLLDATVAGGVVETAARLADAVDARHPGVLLARADIATDPAPRPADAWIDGTAWTGDPGFAPPVAGGTGGADTPLPSDGDGPPAESGGPPDPPAAETTPPADDTAPSTGGTAPPTGDTAPPVGDTAPPTTDDPTSARTGSPAGGDPGPPSAPRFAARPGPPPSPGPAPRLVDGVARIPAALVPWTFGGADMPTRGFRAGPGLLHDDEAVLRLDPEDGTVAWRTELVPTEIELLAADDQTFLLWTGDRRGSLGMREAAAVVALDAATGRVVWTTPPVDELLPPAIGGDRSSTRMPNNYAFSPDEVIVRVDGPRILLARRNGTIVALDRRFGDVVHWRVETGFEQLHELEPGPLGIVASGQRRRAGQPLPQQVVIDPEDGRIIARLEDQAPFAPAWLRGDGLGTVLAGSEAGIVAIDTLTGGRRWILTDYAARGTSEAWRRGELMIVRDRTGDLRPLDPLTGRLGEAFGQDPAEADALAGPTAVVGYDRDLLALGRDRLVRFAPDGTVLGADAIAELLATRTRQAVAVTADGWLVLLAQFQREDGDGIDRFGRRGPTRFTYRLYVLSPDGRVQDDVVELEDVARPLTAMQVVGEHLLLGTQFETLVIPLSRQPRQPRQPIG